MKKSTMGVCERVETQKMAERDGKNLRKSRGKRR